MSELDTSYVPPGATQRHRKGANGFPIFGFVRERNGAGNSRFRAPPTGSWRKAAITRTARQLEEAQGHDAMHRTRIFHTHPTHACGELFRGFDAMLIASRHRSAFGNGGNPPLLAMADRILTEAAS